MLGIRVRSGALLIALILTVAGCAAPQATPMPAAPVASPTSAQVNTVAPSPTVTTAPTATAAVATATPTAAIATAAPLATPTASTASAEDTVILVVIPERSEARYRVREQLAGVELPNDAVGATQAISGTIVGKVDGSIVSAESKIVVDLRTLKSDRSQRDNFLRNNTLQTNRYPYATFVPISAPGLPTILPPSRQASFKLVGELTIRDVTKEVTWDADCQVTEQEDEATCHATTSFTFGFFNLTQPRVPVVLSIVDNITLEVDLVLQRVKR
jgi:polyisoprenoid-binding protein YceI